MVRRMYPGLGALAAVLVEIHSAQGQIIAAPASLIADVAQADTTGFDFSPVIVNDKRGNWVAAWASTHNLGGTAGTDADIFVVTSNDEGANWSATELLNSTGTIDGSASDQLPQIATDQEGNWVAVWYSRYNLSGSGSDDDILVSTSTDNGNTWSAAALMNSTATLDAGRHDDTPQIVTDGEGTWISAWRSTYNLNGTAGTDTDLFVSRSTDNGTSWSAVALLNATATSDGSAADEYPNITSLGNGEWLAAWASTHNLDGDGITDQDLFISRSTDDGLSWSTPALLSNTAAADGAASDAAPQLASDSNGNLIAVWHSTYNLNAAGGDFDIFTATSTDNGATWSDAEVLNRTASVDGAAIDLLPQITTDSGIWLTTWYSEYDLGGVAGTDNDIFISRSLDNGAHWSMPVLLNTYGTSDADDDASPQLSSGENGSLLAVWSSSYDIEDDSSTDYEILFTSIGFGGDDTPPEVVSISTLAPTPGSADAITFTVTFAENVLEFDGVNDVEIIHSGTSHQGVNVSGGPQVFSVEVDGIAGDGQLTVSIPANADIVDEAGNALTLGAASSALQIDNTHPTVTLSSLDATHVAGAIVVDVSLSEAPVILDSSDITTVNATLSDFTGSGTSYSFTLTPVHEGEFSSVVDGAAFSDAAGNASIGSNTLSRVYDATLPDISAVVVTPNVAKPGELVIVTFSVSEDLATDPEVMINGRRATLSTRDKAPGDFTYIHNFTSTEPLGEASLEVYAQDLAGNVGQYVSSGDLTIVPFPLPLVAAPVFVALVIAFYRGVRGRNREH